MKYLNHLTLQVKQLDVASGVQAEMKPLVMLIQPVCGIIFQNLHWGAPGKMLDRCRNQIIILLAAINYYVSVHVFRTDTKTAHLAFSFKLDKKWPSSFIRQ